MDAVCIQRAGDDTPAWVCVECEKRIEQRRRSLRKPGERYAPSGQKTIGYCIEFNAKPWKPGTRHRWPKIFPTAGEAWAHIRWCEDRLFGKFSKWDERQRGYLPPAPGVRYFISCSVEPVRSTRPLERRSTCEPQPT